jgi:hypothetical protein
LASTEDTALSELTTIDEETGEITAAPITSLPAMDQAEINMQIVTARAYPRSLKQVSSRIFNLITLDEESAEECVYALPRGGKPIKGPSIRFAEALKQSYGNCRSAARVVDVNRVEKYVEAEGVFFDLETNTATSARVRRRISGRDGRIFNDDMIIVTGNAACSIAMRNAILGGVPKPLWRNAYNEANRVISGDVTTLAVNREKAFKALAAFGVSPEQVFGALDVKGAEDITVDHIGLLRGMYATLKNGEATVEEMFSSATAEKKADPTYNPLDKAKETAKPKEAAKPAAPSAVDPDYSRAGAQAFVDGEVREAPDDFTAEQQAWWTAGYDEAGAAMNGSRQ